MLFHVSQINELCLEMCESIYIPKGGLQIAICSWNGSSTLPLTDKGFKVVDLISIFIFEHEKQHNGADDLYFEFCVPHHVLL